MSSTMITFTAPMTYASVDRGAPYASVDRSAPYVGAGREGVHAVAGVDAQGTRAPQIRLFDAGACAAVVTDAKASSRLGTNRSAAGATLVVRDAFTSDLPLSVLGRGEPMN